MMSYSWKTPEWCTILDITKIVFFAIFNIGFKHFPQWVETRKLLRTCSWQLYRNRFSSMFLNKGKETGKSYCWNSKTNINTYYILFCSTISEMIFSFEIICLALKRAVGFRATKWLPLWVPRQAEQYRRFAHLFLVWPSWRWNSVSISSSLQSSPSVRNLLWVEVSESQSFSSVTDCCLWSEVSGTNTDSVSFSTLQFRSKIYASLRDLLIVSPVGYTKTLPFWILLLE